MNAAWYSLTVRAMDRYITVPSWEMKRRIIMGCRRYAVYVSLPNGAQRGWPRKELTQPDINRRKKCDVS